MQQPVVGIDPSLTSTGVAIHLPDPGLVEVPRIITHRVRSTGTADATWPEREARIINLAADVAAVVPAASRVFIEGPAYSKSQGSSHDRAGYWWRLYSLLAAKNCPITVVMPNLRVKYALGTSRGSKDEVMASAIRRYPDADITGNDVADAVVILAMGCRLLQIPLEVGLSKDRIDALKTFLA